MATPKMPTIHAGGAVLWRRRDGDGEVELAIIHRPRYDDWSLPKGKVDHAETIQAAAVREIREETGFPAVLGRRLRTVTYPIEYRGTTATKVVHYFAARAGNGGVFEPGDEVDELRWLPVRAVRDLLTYRWDQDVLDRFLALPPNPMVVLLVRHAKAGVRAEWAADDDLRPLTEPGKRQAAALRELLPLFGADRVHSAPLVRCRETVAAVADDLACETKPTAGGPMQPEPLLSETSYWRAPERGLARLFEIVRAGGTPVVCSQGGVIPDLVGALAFHGGLDLGEPASKKGSVWVLSFDPVVRTDHGRVPRLIAADYIPNPAR